MTYDPGYEGYLKEIFDQIDGVTFRRMFGGLGIFRHGLMFALCTSEGQLCLKADATTKSRFADAGCREWIPVQKGRKPVSIGYWYAPEHIFDDDEAFLEWSEVAFEAAVRVDQRKPPSQRKLKS